MQSIFLIGIAGAAGAVSRYAVGVIADRSLGSSFAFGTLVVNVLGCLALGFILEHDRDTGTAIHTLRLPFAVGFLGAFTTFSAFGHETMRYLQAGSGQLALANVTANLVLGVGAVWLGYFIARMASPVV